MSDDVHAFAADQAAGRAMGFGTVRATHAGEGGPASTTGKRVGAEHASKRAIDSDRVRHMAKVWNDGFSFRQIGWA